MSSIKERLAVKLSNNFTKIIPIDDIIRHKIISWSNSNNIQKIFNYELIYNNKKTKKYSENDSDYIDKK